MLPMLNGFGQKWYVFALTYAMQNIPAQTGTSLPALQHRQLLIAGHTLLAQSVCLSVYSPSCRNRFLAAAHSVGAADVGPTVATELTAVRH